jgi:transposase InsO family protein
MMSHKNAKLTKRSRLAIVRRFERGESGHRIAEALGIARSTVFKWIQRYRLEGEDGMADRTSRPDQMPTAMSEEMKSRVERLRRQRWSYDRIAAEIGRSRAAVARVAKERRVARLDRLDPREPVIRYERAEPGELVHVDIKKLGRIEYGVGHRITGDRRGQSSHRGSGWEFAHVCVDDASRVAYVEVLDDERGDTATAFMQRAIAWYADRSVRVERIMTDNGSAYLSRTFRALCQHLGIRHVRTRPYTPRTNGKAERFIQTAMREWAYERAFATSAARAAMLGRWLHRYNWHRPHTALNGNAPMTRINAGVLNLLGSHI